MNMKGSVNEHYFEIEGEGKGKPNEEVSLKRQTMHQNLLLNKELNKITLHLSIKARYSVMNDFWKLPK